MTSPSKKDKINLGESIRQKLKNLSIERCRPFDEILRYYAMERFLYRLSVSSYSDLFFLKGGLMLKVWNSLEHRATMDIDLLAKTSNSVQNLKKIIVDISLVEIPEDAILFNTDKLILNQIQVGGDYQGVRASFLAQLFRTKIPVLIDIGFNDIVIPTPNRVCYPTLLKMPQPSLLGYNRETVVAEKLESIVKLGGINTRMKDFYDLWKIFREEEIDQERLALAIETVFENRGTEMSFPNSLKGEFLDNAQTMKRWSNFLSGIGVKQLEFQTVLEEISNHIKPYLIVGSGVTN